MSRSVESLQAATREFLNFLQRSPLVRAQIRAPKDGTLLFSGKQIRSTWDEISELKKRGELTGLYTLPDILSHIAVPETGYRSLLDYANAVCGAVPWEDDGFIVWRALSGIFASQAEGRVSFHVGKDISADKEDVKRRRVLAVTELPVLARNPGIDTLTRDVLDYYMRCMKNKNHAVSFSFIGGGTG